MIAGARFSKPETTTKSFVPKPESDTIAGESVKIAGQSVTIASVRGTIVKKRDVSKPESVGSREYDNQSPIRFLCAKAR